MLRWREHDWVPLHAGSYLLLFSGVKLGEDKDLVWGVKPPTESTYYIRGGKIPHMDCQSIHVRIRAPSVTSGITNLQIGREVYPKRDNKVSFLSNLTAASRGF